MDAESKERGRDYLAADIFLTTARLAGLPLEDIMDATVVCWSALLLAEGKARSLVEPVPDDTTGLPMTIWV